MIRPNTMTTTTVVSLTVAFLAVTALPTAGQCPTVQTTRVNVSTLPAATRRAFTRFQSPGSDNNLGETLETLWPRWTENLPACPCQEPAGNANWELRNTRTSYYHPGARNCYRSTAACAPTVEYEEDGFFTNSVTSPKHGQQCCYAENGFLITQGPGAGTPDFYAPAFGQILNHNSYDVGPWERLGWRDYTVHWKPSKGANCEITLTADSRAFTPAHLYVAAKQTLTISASGKIRWYDKAQAWLNRSLAPTGPEGYSGTGYLKLPLPLANEPTGSLIGWIGFGLPQHNVERVDPNRLTPQQRQPLGQFIAIGANRSVTIPVEGMLWLTVNDAIIANNEGAFDISIGNPPK